MSEVGESIIRGMEEVLAFAKGEKTEAVVHILEESDVQNACLNSVMLESKQERDNG